MPRCIRVSSCFQSLSDANFAIGVADRFLAQTTFGRKARMCFSQNDMRGFLLLIVS